MARIDSARMESLADGLQVGQNALVDTDLLGLARNYKKNKAARYRLLSENDIAKLESDKLFASLKLDGQLHFLYKKGDECFLYNIKGRVVLGLPLLAEAKQKLADVDHILLAGELYFQNPQGRPRVYDVTAALGSGGAGKSEKLAFAAFDLLELENASCYPMDFTEKQEKLSALFSYKGACHALEQHAVDSKNLSQLYKKWVTEGDEEGIVCVDEGNHTVYKIKPKHNVDAVVIGFTESPDIVDNIRVLLTALMRPDGSYQVFAKVGTGFDDDQRRSFFNALKAMAVPSDFKTTDRNHTLFTMVRPEMVIEMAFHDLIYESAQGKPEMKAVLQYDENAGYRAQLPQAFVSVLGPVFKRIRDDKRVTPEDLRLTQLQAYVDLDNLNQASKNLDLAESSVLQREVFTKTTKGLVSVRKFICWKTNKDELDSDYPAFVFCFVDYSPGRKDPLKRLVRTAHTQPDIEAVYSEFKESEVKRGWKPA